MSVQYKRFLKILEKWPVDKTKIGRDLGEKIRKQVSKYTNPTTLTSDETAVLSEQVDALERLANNTYGKRYRRLHNSTATGLTAVQCSQVLSSEFLQYLNDEKPSDNH